MEAGDRVSVKDMQEALVTSVEEKRLGFALKLAKWYSDERDLADRYRLRADYYRRQSDLHEYQANQWYICACGWMVATLIACLGILLLIAES